MSDRLSSRKLKEKLERKKRYQLDKEYANALKRGPVRDPTMAAKQHAFCVKLIKEILNDETSLSFSKPVTELWDVDDLPGYFEKVKKPMDLGTILENLEKDEFINKDTELFDFSLFVKDARLVFNNCMSYNSPGTELAKLAKRFLTWFDRSIREIPLQKPDKDVAGKSENDTPEKAEKADASDSEDDKKNASSGDEGSVRRGGDPERKARKSSDYDKHAATSEKSGSGDENSDNEASDGDLVEGKSDSKSKRGKGEDGDEDQLERLTRKVSNLKQLKARAEGNLAEIDMERNVPMTAEERVALRDEVEEAPWEKVDKVVQILKKYVDSAVNELGKGADPEYVTLELNDVEPHLLRDVEAVVRPDPRREMEMKKIEKINSDLAETQRRIKELKRPGGSLSGSRKKQKRRR